MIATKIRIGTFLCLAIGLPVAAGAEQSKTAPGRSDYPSFPSYPSYPSYPAYPSYPGFPRYGEFPPYAPPVPGYPAAGPLGRPGSQPLGEAPWQAPTRANPRTAPVSASTRSAPIPAPAASAPSPTAPAAPFGARPAPYLPPAASTNPATPITSGAPAPGRRPAGSTAAQNAAGATAPAGPGAATSTSAGGHRQPVTPADLAGSAVFRAEQGRLGTVLADPEGRTLYLSTRDPEGASDCTGACAELWRPFLLADSARPVAPFGAVERSDGTRQWTHAGRPLYLWSGDTGAGDVTGDGIDGSWYAVRVASPDSIALSATGSGR